MRFPNPLKLRLTAAAAALLATTAWHAAAQGTDSLLTTVGTTVEHEGDTYAYLLWQPGEAGTTLGKRFSINRKDGPADSSNAYQRLGIQTLHTSANTVRAMLGLGAKIDRSHDIGIRRIDGLYRDITHDPGADPIDPSAPGLDAANQLVHLIASAVGDTETLSRLFFLGRAHPGVMMALGHAYQTPLPSGVHTFEIREVGLDDEDIRVVGRITLDTANPVQLAPPTSPVRVWHPVDEGSQYTVSAKDHLNARFRWGLPPRLMEQLPHAFGFDLFRVREKTAETLGWHVDPPTPREMLDALATTDPGNPDPDFSQVNDLPILVEEMLTPAEAGDMDDTETIKYFDDGIWYDGKYGRRALRPYADGEAFYYFVAARGIAGHPGNLSPGTLARMCDTLPPKPPVVDSVFSRFVPPEDAAEGQGGAQYLEVKIRQLPHAPAEASAGGYYIYRWESPQEYLNNLGNPEIGRIGYVAHESGQTFVTFDDDGPGAPTLETHEDTSVWYTARAVGLTKCSGEILSGHSGPTPGFLRDFVAPDAPTGDFTICRRVPFAEYERREVGDPEKFGLPEDHIGITIRATREDSAIVAADVRVVRTILPDRVDHVLHSARHLFQRSESVEVHLPYPEPRGEMENIRIEVRGVTAHGIVSFPAMANTNGAQEPAPFVVYPFTLRTEENCRPFSEVTEPRPMHEAFDEDGSANPITGSISFSDDQNVREWRVYRRVGTDGPLTLIARMEGDEVASPAPWMDDALPAASGARVCYFAQVLDQNANPSPLFPIGCTELVNPDLPTPMLAKAEVIDEDDGRMLVNLEWFCDPVGVERFEILIAREGGGIPEADGLTPYPGGGPVSIESDDYADLTFHRFTTGRVTGPNMGDGPEFSRIVGMDPTKTHFIAVRALGPGNPGMRAAGSASNVLGARWTPPDDGGPQPVIPWPARPVAPTFDHRRPIVTYTQEEGPLWALTLPQELSNYATQILVGVTRDPIEESRVEPFTKLETPAPPEEALFRVRGDLENAGSLEDLMPFMLYRYQMPSDLYPDARPNLVQCTPMIDRIAWRFIRTEEEEFYEIRDPYLRFYEFRGQENFELPLAGTWTDDSPPITGPPRGAENIPPYLQRATGLVLLNDMLPVTVGAKYRHLIVQFDDRGEIRRVIPLDPIQH